MTATTPWLNGASCENPASDRSITLVSLLAWRSSTVHTVEAPLVVLTVTIVPKGRVGLAQVPAAVAYHVAIPVWEWLGVDATVDEVGGVVDDVGVDEALGALTACGTTVAAGVAGIAAVVVVDEVGRPAVEASW